MEAAFFCVKNTGRVVLEASGITPRSYEGHSARNPACGEWRDTSPQQPNSLQTRSLEAWQEVLEQAEARDSLSVLGGGPTPEVARLELVAEENSAAPKTPSGPPSQRPRRRLPRPSESRPPLAKPLSQERKSIEGFNGKVQDHRQPFRCCDLRLPNTELVASA